MKIKLLVAINILVLIIALLIVNHIIQPEKSPLVINKIPKSFKSSIVNNKQIRIAIVDTGLNLINNSDVVLCNDHSKIDFTSNADNIDYLGHGTNIAYIIADRLKGLNYCITAIKVFSSAKEDSNNFINSISNAYNFIIENKYDVVNLSYGGYDKISQEEKGIISLIDSNVVIFAAAGNEHNLLTFDNCLYYPACYSSKIHTIGNIDNKNSNYGEYVREWEDGNRVYGGGYTMSGTSQATAIATAKYVRRLLK